MSFSNISNTLDTVRAIKANALAGAGGVGVNVGKISISVQGAPGQPTTSVPLEQCQKMKTI